MARQLLEDAGLEVLAEAAGGGNGLGNVRALRPGLVLLDVQLPDLDGFAVAEELVRTSPDTAVVLTSVRPAADYSPRRMAAASARGFVAKASCRGRSLLSCCEASHDTSATMGGADAYRRGPSRRRRPYLPTGRVAPGPGAAVLRRFALRARRDGAAGRRPDGASGPLLTATGLPWLDSQTLLTVGNDVMATVGLASFPLGLAFWHTWRWPTPTASDPARAARI